MRLERGREEWREGQMEGEAEEESESVLREEIKVFDGIKRRVKGD